MKTVGIICEYNPFHLGHMGHIKKTRQILGSDAAVVCVMSGNFVQRGDFALFNKHARAKTAVLSGADLVIELPTPYVLRSAEGFAGAGVFILNNLGICDHLSFGSESGDIQKLGEAADMIIKDNAQELTREWLKKGISYAAAQQKAADEILGENAAVFAAPNNVLGIEYIKALKKYNSTMQPMTVKRTGGEHDSNTGYSASNLRMRFLNGKYPETLMPEDAFNTCKEELASGRGPVSIKYAEQAILARLRAIKDFENIPGSSEGLERRFKRYAANESSLAAILNGIKTKRYPMSRLQRMLVCAALGISNDYSKSDPPYARILALNPAGMDLLSKIRKKAKIPVITKPASIYKLDDESIKLFELEAAATDLYVLAYRNEEERRGGQEWRKSPVVID